MKMLRECYILLIFVIAITLCNGQRPSYAGSRPQSGYKDKFKPAQASNATNDLENRFGEELLSNQTQKPPVFLQPVLPEQEFVPIVGQRVDENPTIRPVTQQPGMTTRLPYDALGDKELIDRLMRLPPEQRPFWLLNSQVIEAHRGTVQNQTTLQNNQNITGINQGGNVPLNQGIISTNAPTSGNINMNQVLFPTTNTLNQNIGSVGTTGSNFNPTTNQGILLTAQNLNNFNLAGLENAVAGFSQSDSQGNAQSSVSSTLPTPIDLSQRFSDDSPTDSNESNRQPLNIKQNSAGFPNFGNMNS